MADRDELLDQLKVLPTDQFYELALRCKFKRSSFGEGTNLNQRVIELIEHMEDRDATLEELARALQRVLAAAAPSFQKKRSTPGAEPATSKASSGPTPACSAKQRESRPAPPSSPLAEVAQQATPAPTGSALPQPPSSPPPVPRAALRRLMDKVLLTAPELDAFLLDYFPEVYARIQRSHDRATRINLLFTMWPNEEILEALHKHAPEEVARNATLLTEPAADPVEDSLSEQARYEGRIELRKLLEQLFPFDSELNAFCLDYFPELGGIQATSKDIDRIYKHDLLINSTRPAKLFASLCRQYPEKLQQLEHPEAEPAPTLPSLRSLLRAVLPDNDELLRFCRSRYPEVSRRLSYGFDRVHIENTLLQGTRPVDLIRKMRETHPQRSARFDHLLELGDSPAGPEATAALRDLLSRSLPLESELDAFCMDYFPAVYRSFTDGTNKEEKLKRLLSGAPSSAIHRALRRQRQDLDPDSLPAPAALRDKVQTRSGVTVSQGMLRQLVYGLFAIEGELIRFCSAYFPHAAHLMMPNMAWDQKVNILLQKSDPGALVARLREYSHDDFERLSTQQLQRGQDFIAQLTDPENQDITRLQLRRLLDRVLIGDSLLLFCSDYFPSVGPLVSVGMDRISIVNLLLERVSASTVLAALRYSDPEQVRQIEASF